MQLDIVDVFAEAKYAGNQLAVVRDAAGLDTAAMQTIAREMNFSETSFVTRADAQSADVRIFTPSHELPFAGHPTLGTAWVLSGGVGTYQINLAAGEVPVEFADGIGWLTSPPVVLGDEMPSADAAALLGLAETALHPDFPRQFADVGPSFVLLGLRSSADLQAVQVHEPTFQRLRAANQGKLSVFAFTPQDGAGSTDFAARMFFDVGGLREDPATGSANCAFAAYLQKLKGNLGPVVVDQGVEMLRPSRLYLRVGTPIAVGGRVFASACGQLV